MTPQEIKTLLIKKGLRHKDLELKYSLSTGATRTALKTAHRKGEEALSKELGIPLQKLFPTRYDQKGNRHEPQPSSNYRYYTDHELANKQAKG